MMISEKRLTIALMLMLGLPVLLYFSPFYYFPPEQKSSRVVADLVERNLEARGGVDAWQEVTSLQLSGRMDVGQGMNLPYVLEQKRPGKMRLEFVFDGETAVQAFDGKTGWKVLPFLGRRNPEPMTKTELRTAVDTSDLYGLLFAYDARGHKVELVGQEPVAGHNAFKLKVTLPGGTVRWVYLDVETALDVKVEAMRELAGRELRVETFYYDWLSVEGLLIAGRQETQTEGESESHFLTVESVQVNPPLDDARFTIPAVVTDVARQAN